MVNYQNGKIYRIDGGGLTYVGSTTAKYLSSRLAKHKSQYKRYLDGENHYYTSFEVLKSDNYKIELIENFPCNSKDELNAREGHYIRKINCVNQIVTGRTRKEYREDNKEAISAQKKQHYENNKEKILERVKQYYEDNKETKKEYYKQYYETNKEKLNQKHTCECGGRYTIKRKAQHLKTSKHINFIKD